MKKLFQSFVICGAILGASTASMASVSGVGGSSVTKDKLSLEGRVSLDNDDQWLNRFYADYGVTDSYAVRLAVQGRKSAGDDYEHDRIFLENRFELTDQSEAPFYSGVRFRYVFKDGDKKPDTADFRIVLGKTYEGWDFRTNQIFYHEVGQDSEGGFGLESNFKVDYKLSDTMKIGVDSFNNFGRLNKGLNFDERVHTVGPYFSQAINDSLSYEIGYRAGLSDEAPDNMIRVFVSGAF